jgi:hypothetical protein
VPRSLCSTSLLAVPLPDGSSSNHSSRLPRCCSASAAVNSQYDTMQSNTALQINNYTLVGVVDLSCLQQGQAHSVLSVLLCRLNGMFSELCWPRRWFACLLGSGIGL